MECKIVTLFVYGTICIERLGFGNDPIKGAFFTNGLSQFPSSQRCIVVGIWTFLSLQPKRIKLILRIF